MKQIFLRLGVVSGLVLGLFSTLLVARAMTPTLSVSATGSGDSVIVTVYGDPYASVTLYYQNQGYGYGSQSQYLGTTSSSGYLATTVSASTYGVTAGSSVYVTVNNQTSTNVLWPYNNNNNYNYGAPTLSQTNISVTVGQSANVTIYGGNAPYTMYNSGSSIFQAVISGNSLQIAGINTGTGSVNICSAGGTGSGCVNLYVTVNYNSNYYNPPIYNNPVQSVVTFGQTNPTLYVGQSMTVSLAGGSTYNYNYYNNYNNNNYNVAYNSNSSLVTAYISGNSLVIQGVANGNASVVVCSTSMNCSALNIVVGGTYYNNYNNNNSGNWTQCANEGGYCSFSGTRNVRYGASGMYFYKTMSNGASCSNATFGDPAFGVAKQCSISSY